MKLPRQKISVTALAAACTVLLGLTAFLFFENLRPEEYRITFDTLPADTGPLEAINGTIFPYARGHVVVTENLAHLRVPFHRTLLGKRLRVRPRFHLDEADVLEVGVKKSPFWLDYDRKPLQHRPLDSLLGHTESAWNSLRSGPRVVYLNPRFDAPWKSVEEFEQNPPGDGLLGLYGNAQFQNPSSRFPIPNTRPFRVDDTPDDFRAIYAWYPEPDRSNPEWTENEQEFDLSRMFQNADGSLELMFFVQRKENQPIRLLIDELTLRIEPGWPKFADLVSLVRHSLVRLIRRPPASL